MNASSRTLISSAQWTSSRISTVGCRAVTCPRSRPTPSKSFMYSGGAADSPSPGSASGSRRPSSRRMASGRVPSHPRSSDTRPARNASTQGPNGRICSLSWQRPISTRAPDLVDLGRQFGHESRLAHARLADDGRHPTLPADGLGERRSQPRHLSIAPDERGVSGQAEGLAAQGREGWQPSRSRPTQAASRATGLRRRISWYSSLVSSSGSTPSSRCRTPTQSWYWRRADPRRPSWA